MKIAFSKISGIKIFLVKLLHTMYGNRVYNIVYRTNICKSFLLYCDECGISMFRTQRGLFRMVITNKE